MSRVNFGRVLQGTRWSELGGSPELGWLGRARSEVSRVGQGDLGMEKGAGVTVVGGACMEK